ncbi:MAG: hypothetical protein HUU38_31930 [Anaerolineales bacterium]|nr:hypothetical protein [Anaerolineales bacterium]
MTTPTRTFPAALRFLALLVGMLLLTACTPPVAPTPAEGENAVVSPSGESQTVYLPLAQSGNTTGAPLPTDPPLTEWTVAGGVVPVMPGAQAGAEAEGRYVFITPVSLAEVEAYYLQEMPNRGWQTLSIGESMEIKDLLFQLGDARLTIRIEFLADKNLSYVVIEG